MDAEPHSIGNGAARLGGLGFEPHSGSSDKGTDNCALYNFGWMNATL